MKKIILSVAIFLISLCSLSQIPPTDKNADPFKDLEKAKSYAQKNGKRILLIVGGDWCEWCDKLDNFINKDKELLEILNKNYVVVKVYSKGDLTPNGLFLAKFPSISQFPHIFVLNFQETLLESKQTTTLEKGETYDKSKVKEFLEYWAIKK